MLTDSPFALTGLNVGFLEGLFYLGDGELFWDSECPDAIDLFLFFFLLLFLLF